MLRTIARHVLGLACALAALGGAAQARPVPVGSYRVAEGPDVAGGLAIAADGRFAYTLTAGALDERAQGRWQRDGERICLTTEPRPVPPQFRQVARAADESESPTILVTWPDGRGIAGIDFQVGFDSGEPIADYTQEYGWTLPEGERRIPRWIELSEPIHGLASPRFAVTAGDNGMFRAVLVPNDLGVVDFQGACLAQARQGYVLHRREGAMRLVRTRG